VIIPANTIISRAERFVRLRYRITAVNVDRSFMVAQICARMAARLYARGHLVAEYGRG
jgi:hypothetical protein